MSRITEVFRDTLKLPPELTDKKGAPKYRATRLTLSKRTEGRHQQGTPTQGVWEKETKLQTSGRHTNKDS